MRLLFVGRDRIENELSVLQVRFNAHFVFVIVFHLQKRLVHVQSSLCELAKKRDTWQTYVNELSCHVCVSC
jgi:hypothetical protein